MKKYMFINWISNNEPTIISILQADTKNCKGKRLEPNGTYTYHFQASRYVFDTVADYFTPMDWDQYKEGSNLYFPENNLYDTLLDCRRGLLMDLLS